MSLLELLAMLAILAAVCWIAVPRLARGTHAARSQACRANIGNIEIQVELWYRDRGVWPVADLGDIGADRSFFPDGLPVCPVDGSRYTIDPRTRRVVGHQHGNP